MWVFLVMKSGHCSEVCPLRITPMKIPVADLVPRVPTMLISEKWQQFWNSCTGNKLQAIKPTVGGHQPKSSLSRRDEVVVNRLRIGHTRCTHSYLLTGEDLTAQLVSVHSLSSTSLSIVLILTILATNILLLPLWRNYLELRT